MSAYYVFMGFILTAGWAKALMNGFDGATVVCLLIAWLLGRAKAEWAAFIAWLLLLTALASGAGAALGALMGGMALLALIVGGFRRPTRSLRWAIISAALLLALMSVASTVWGLDTLSAPPFALVPLWLLAAGIPTCPLSRRVLRWGSLPAIPLALALGAYALAGGEVARRERSLEEFQRELAGQPPTAQLPAIRQRIAVDPWVPGMWAQLGELYLAAGQFDEAHAAFRKGYRVRPGKANPCRQQLAQTTAALGRWRDAADLAASGDLAITPSSHAAATAFAAELWRQNMAGRAREIMGPWEVGNLHATELAGWLAHEDGDDSAALGLLLPLLDDSLSGESMYRAAMAADVLGLDRIRDDLLRIGAERHPRHLRLGQVARLSPPELPAHRFWQGILLGNTVRLLAWDGEPDPVRAGDTLAVSMVWEPTKPLPALQLILHLDLGTPPLRRVNADCWPDGRREATREWPVGEPVIVATRVPIPADAPSGRYTVYTGMWIPGDRESRLLPGPADAQRVPRGEHRFPLGDVTVVGPAG